MATVRCRSAAKGAAVTQTYDGSGNAVTGYVYDLADNRIETHRPEGGIWKQSFDARNQVSSESGPIAGMLSTYVYDNAGNRDHSTELSLTGFKRCLGMRLVSER